MCFNVLFNMKIIFVFNYFLWWFDFGIILSMFFLFIFSNLSVLFCVNLCMRVINVGGWIWLFVRLSFVKILFDFNIFVSVM